MDPRFLPFSIAAGILLAAFAIILVKVGMNIYRNNDGWRSLFGAALFVSGLAFGLMVMLAGANPQ